jgi:hypothetical protein
LQPLEGPQLQKRLTLRWGFVVGDDVDPYAAVDDAFLPLRSVPGLPGGSRPARGAALTIEGAEVSAVRRTRGGQVEVRLFNPTAGPATAELRGRRGWVVDLLGRPLAPFEGRVALDPWQIATLVLAE